MAVKTRMPIKLRAAVYYFGFDPDEVVDLRYLDTSGQKVWVHLRKDDLEWKGNLEAPSWSVRPVVTRVEDLVNNTQDCPTCGGSGKMSAPKE